MGDPDQERFELLYRQHFRAVLRYALARVEPERAEDVAAETFLVAWRRLDQVPDDPAPWLYAVARKVVADHLRADARRDALTERLSALANSGDDGPPDPAEQVAQRHSALAALARLDEHDREILTLVAWDGLSNTLAAQALGCSVPHFAFQLHKARSRLTRAMAVEDAAARDAPRPAKPGARFITRQQLPARERNAG